MSKQTKEDFYDFLNQETYETLKAMVNACILTFDEIDINSTKSEIINVIVNRTNPDIYLYMASFYDEKKVKFANKVMTASEWLDWYKGD